MRIWLILGGLNGLVAVIAGAYGYHSLTADSGPREFFAIGVQYQMWHALALLGVAWMAAHRKGSVHKVITVAGLAFTSGIVLFSGSLYIFAITGDVPIPGLAPAGGVCLMIGWCALIAAGLKKR